MTILPRIWIDEDHGKNSADWTFYPDGSVSGKMHLRAGRIPYVPEKSQDLAALQKKAAKQRNEIARLTQALEAVTNDLADVKRQRDDLKEFARVVATLPGSGPEGLAHRARRLLGSL